jgi:metacaspase-1
MAQGRALCIGVGRVDPALYHGDPFPTLCAEADAAAMGALAKAQGFDVRLLTTSGQGAEPAPDWRGEPDYHTFKREMDDAAEHLRAGDTFLLTFAGHGTVVRQSGTGGVDEAWCLGDCVIVDNLLYHFLTQFKPHVRVWVISDSCHSGTMVDHESATRPRSIGPAGRPAQRLRRGHAEFAPAIEVAAIRPILWRARHEAPRPRALERELVDDPPLEAAVLCVGACLDGAQTTCVQAANAAAPNYSFTQSAIALWQGGAYEKTCWQFCEDLLTRWIPKPADRPPPYWVGKGATFGDQRPALPKFPPVEVVSAAPPG